MKYFGGCDVGSTYTKAVILDENGKMVADTTLKSKIIARESAELAMKDVISQVPDLNKPEDLAYLIGTGYGRNKVPFADENVPVPELGHIGALLRLERARKDSDPQRSRKKLRIPRPETPDQSVRFLSDAVNRKIHKNESLSAFRS